MELADADLAEVGRALSDPHRARIVLGLMGGTELSAGELAKRAGISSSLASAHLSKLLDAGVVSVSRSGRHRNYRLAAPGVAGAIEGLLTISPTRPASGLNQVRAGRALRQARTCYDHLAGRLGVYLVDAFERDGILNSGGDSWELSTSGRQRLGQLGLSDPVGNARRPYIRPCLDWTERRSHIAGGFGATLADLFFQRCWIERDRSSRAVRVTPEGAKVLLSEFAIRL